MFIGVGIGLVYAAIRSALRGHVRALAVILVFGVLIAVAFAVLPINELLSTRLSESSTTVDRANLYQETFNRTLQSPLFGYGGPRPSFTLGAPDAGTQGQVWMVLFSHGFPGLALFLGWSIWAVVRSAREHNPIGFAAHIALLIVLVESFYYGTLLTGLAVAMVAAALTQRPVQRRFVEGVDAPDDAAIELSTSSA
jgi:O-antigen ligase